MKNLTAKGIAAHLLNNYGECNHNPGAMYTAAIETAKATDLSPLEVFKFIIGESKPAGLTSYGFHTAAGRYGVEYFTNQYHAAQ